MKNKLLLFLLLAFSVKATAYDYSEHKDIGNAAMTRLMAELQKSGNAALLLQFLNMAQDEKTNTFYFLDLSVTGGEQVGYGVLNGLSGDHAANPLTLEEQLRRKYTVMQQILLLHNQYMAQGYTTAPNGKLTKKDFSYLLQAAIDMSHFYDYGHTFQQQLKKFDKEYIKQCQNPAQVKSIFNALKKTNTINVYVTLHALAIDLAEQAGQLASSNPEQAKQLLFYAFLFNGFADHFLEDSFASGHLVVNRSVVAGLTNNHALHNFYNVEGCTVVNREGDIWHAYGDSFFNNTHNSWMKDSTLLDIHYPIYTAEADRIIRAVQFSLTDIWNAFEQSYTDEMHTPFYDRIPNDEDAQPDYLIAAMPALKLVPIPFNSDLSTLFPDSVEITDDMQKAGQLLYYRSFVRSRTANSFVVGLNFSPTFGNKSYEGFEFRINVGNPVSLYSHNKYGGKRGTVDYWLGYTLVYSFGETLSEFASDATYLDHQIRVGFRNNVDIWVAEKRFLGLSNYTEAGVQFNNGKASFIFTPSVGIQFGSLLKINYYNMPTWLRVPLQLILPLKIKYGIVLSPGCSPAYFTGLDLDIMF